MPASRLRTRWRRRRRRRIGFKHRLKSELAGQDASPASSNNSRATACCCARTRWKNGAGLKSIRMRFPRLPFPPSRRHSLDARPRVGGFDPRRRWRGRSGPTNRTVCRRSCISSVGDDLLPIRTMIKTWVRCWELISVRVLRIIRRPESAHPPLMFAAGNSYNKNTVELLPIRQGFEYSSMGIPSARTGSFG